MSLTESQIEENAAKNMLEIGLLDEIEVEGTQSTEPVDKPVDDTAEANVADGVTEDL